MSTDLGELKRIDLPAFLSRHYDVRANGGGMARCPFHEDQSPSLSIYQKNGGWAWRCHGCDIGGDIIDFVARHDGIELPDAAKKIREAEGIRDTHGKRQGPPVASYTYQDEEGRELYRVERYANPKDFRTDRKLGNTRRVLYRLPEVKAAETVWVFEGEKDVDNARKLGLVATTAPFGVNHWRSAFSESLKGKCVRVCLDAGYRDEAEKRAADIAKHAAEVKVIELPGLVKDQDISDWIELHDAQTAEDLRAQLEGLADKAPAWGEEQSVKKGDSAVTLLERDPRTVEVKPIPYLWRGVIPTHMATAITGDTGEGKSLVAVDATARLSRGRPFPVYDKPAPPVSGHTFYVTSEGVPEMILVPRLMAAEADLSKVTIIEGVLQKDGNFSIFDITQHLPLILERAKAFPDLKLIIIDPIASFLPERVNANQQNQVRQAMDRISDLAYKLGVAALPIMHFNKNPGGGKSTNRTSGSVQFMASVKMSWSVIRRDSDPRNHRLLVPQKSNISGGHKSLVFSIHGVEFPCPSSPDDKIETAGIKFEGLIDDDPNTLINPPLEKEKPIVLRACEYLTRQLSDGTTHYASDLVTDAEDNAIPKWALYEAKAKLGITHDKEGTFQGRTFWSRPGAGSAA